MRNVPRRSGEAIAAAGFLNGFTEPNAGGRGAQIQQSLRISDAKLSLGWAGWPAGMLLVSLAGGPLLRRFGPRGVLAAGALLYWGAFMLIGFATTPVRLAAVMFVVGVGNGLFDVAWVVYGPWDERRRQAEHGEAAGLHNQILNAFFSGGSLVAALVTLGAVALGVPVGWHLAAVGAIGLGVTLGWAVWQLPARIEDDHDAAPGGLLTRLRGTPWQLRRVGVIGFCAVLPIGVGYLWSGVFLTRLGASHALATGGLIAFTGVEMVGRAASGWLSRRWAFFADPVATSVAGALVAMAGIALIVGVATIPATIAGFGLLALGMSPIAPFVQSAGQRLWPGHRATAAALVTRYSYVALALGPVVIGPLSTHLGDTETTTPLRAALACLFVLPVAIVALARSLR